LIPSTGRYIMEDTRFKTNFFLSWILICVVFFLISLIDKVQASNLLIGAGISSLLLFTMLNKEYGLGQIFMSLLGINTMFIALRQYLFSEFIMTQYNDAVEEFVNMLSSRFQEGSEQYHLFLEVVELSKDFYLNYSPGVWIATMMLCLFLGYYFLSRKNAEMESLSNYQTHVLVIYSLIIALIIAIFWEDQRMPSINYLIALIPLFLIQGLGVLKYKIGKWFLHSKFLVFIAVLSLILNPYITLFITLIGLFDNWFDFRNFSKPEEINENHTDGNA